LRSPATPTTGKPVGCERPLRQADFWVIAVFNNANSLCGILQMRCNPDEMIRHQSRYCVVARAHPRGQPRDVPIAE